MSLHRAEKSDLKNWFIFFPIHTLKWLKTRQKESWWAKDVSENEKGQRVAEYLTKIQPLWRNIEEAWEKTFNNEKIEHEISVLHRFDWICHASGFKVNFSVQKTIEDLKKIDKIRAWENAQ